MKKTKHLLTILLCMLLVSGSVISCSTPPSADPLPADNTETKETVSEESESETSEIDLLPEADYEGYDFHIFSTDPTTLYGFMSSIYAEEETGEPLNDAVFRRNLAIEERYKITISNTANLDSSKTSSEAKQLALSGDDVYSIMSYGIKWQLVDAMQDVFINLHTVDSIDFSQPWWNSEAAKLLTVQDRLYLTFTYMNVFDYEALPGIYVNNDLIDMHTLESPYDLVREGKWTIDKMYEMASAAVQDLDGNGTISEGDILGHVCGIGSFNVLMTATNQPHVLIGEDGRYILNHGTEASIAAAEKIVRLINDQAVTGYQNDQPWTGSAFLEGKALFFDSGLARLSQYREAEFAVGIVPEPKFDEHQEDYRTIYSNQSLTIAIPKSNKDPERTGVITAALSAYSHLPLREVYFESMLKRKAARDEETMDMLDIIVENCYIDVGVMNENSWGDIISSYFHSMRNSGTGQLSSTAAANHSKFETLISNLEETYAKLN